MALKGGLDTLEPGPDTSLDDYTVEIDDDDGSGSASIVATLRHGDGGDDGGDANVASNRATGSRTVTPVLVSDKADQEELKYYNVDADSRFVLTSSWSSNVANSAATTISFTNTQGTPSVLDDEVEAEAEFECATDVDSAVLSASASTIFTTTDKLTLEDHGYSYGRRWRRCRSWRHSSLQDR